jgi:hypothetical protein
MLTIRNRLACLGKHRWDLKGANRDTAMLLPQTRRLYRSYSRHFVYIHVECIASHGIAILYPVRYLRDPRRIPPSGKRFGLTLLRSDEEQDSSANRQPPQRIASRKSKQQPWRNSRQRALILSSLRTVSGIAPAVGTPYEGNQPESE